VSGRRDCCRDGCFSDKIIRCSVTCSWLVEIVYAVRQRCYGDIIFLDDDVCLCHRIEDCVTRAMDAMDATVYENILRYKTTQTYPADETKAVKRRLREKEKEEYIYLAQIMTVTIAH